MLMEEKEDGVFTIQGKADSYRDLARIMVAFDQKEGFENVKIESIYYDREGNFVNFKISFFYAEETEETL